MTRVPVFARPLRATVLAGFALTGTFGGAACTDVSSYSTTATQQYVGCVVPANFVLAGISPTTEMCLTLNASDLQENPGTLSSSDGLFQGTPLRPIPQLWHDPLSTLSFGTGRTKNLLYMATPQGDAGGAGDMTVVLSLMEGGSVEVRLLRGAPAIAAEDASAGSSSTNVFAVFPLAKETNGCANLSAAACALDAQ